MPYDASLKKLNIFFLSKKKLGDDSITTSVCQYGAEISDTKQIFNLAKKRLIKTNGYNLKLSKFRLKIKSNKFKDMVNSSQLNGYENPDTPSSFGKL